MNASNKTMHGTLISRSQTSFWHPFDPANRLDPYPMYAQLRQHDPVHQTGTGDWVISRYDETCSILADKRFEVIDMPTYFKAKTLIDGGTQQSLAAIYDASYRWLLYTTRPAHARFRELVMRIWPSLDFAGCIRAVLADIAHSLGQLAQPDLVDDLAKRVPAMIMARLLGFPEDGVSNVQEWGERLATIFEPMLTRPQLLAINKAAVQFMALIDQTVAEHECHPRPTLIGQLLTVSKQEGVKIERAELLSLINNLFIAGGETTRNLISNGIYLLDDYPSQRARLQEDTGLMKAAVDEMLRYESPVQLTVRVALEDVSVNKHLIRAGQQVYLCLGSANRDEAQFERADQFAIDRQKNKHLAFGYGAHFCLGSQLARQQAMATFELLLGQFSHLRLDRSRTARRRNLLLRGFVSLPTLP